MLFWMALIAFFLVIALTIFLIFLGFVQEDEDLFLIAAVMMLPLFFASAVVVKPWISHANDLSAVTHQHHSISVHSDRIDSLESRLNSAQYPDKPMVSLDQDSPWATMMRELSQAETKLAESKDERARAIRSIEARRNGPMSGVILLVGDLPKELL